MWTAYPYPAALTFFFRFYAAAYQRQCLSGAAAAVRVSKGKKYKYAFDEAERDKYIAEFADADGAAPPRWRTAV